VLQQFTGTLKRVRIIPHGVSDRFRQEQPGGKWEASTGPVKCVYVSNVDMYKHQWHVVSAIAKLRAAGHNVVLSLVGGGEGRAMKRLQAALAANDPTGAFVQVIDAVAHEEIPQYLAGADLFIFASSCENMPNTLVEAMASGLPIACSNRGPMGEILQDAGTYFDPEDPDSIARAVEQLLLDVPQRESVAEKAWALSKQYSWARCARETWSFLAEVAVDARTISP
jgi:glycosyltransferase involved in cell wall biosynthesis